MTMPFEHNHDFDFGVWRSKFEIASGMGPPIHMERIRCESSIYDHDID